MSADSSHDTWPSSFQSEVNELRRASTCAASRSPVTACAAPSRRLAASRAWPLRRSAFEGMHAQYEHSPPTSSASTIATESPRLWA